MKKIVSFILVFAVLSSVFITASANQAEAKLKEIYGDNMLFKQNEEAIISGTGNPSSTITLEVFDSNNNSVADETATVNDSGSFEISFTAPAGSFESYSVILKQDGKVFSELNNVVFGELWLASGQSNMQYPLGQAKHGIDMMNKGEKLNKNLRVMIAPFFAEYDNTVGVIPANPVDDIPGTEWITGESRNIYGMSAVAYYFANKMIDELGMPVGILNISLGGSTIASWLSRESIESNGQVKNDFIELGKYIELSDWDKEKRSIYYDMSTNFNLKINAIKDFRLSGMIWYQGETDISWSGDAYSRAFDLLQKSYTDHFEYKNGLLPIVFTQLASFYYTDGGWILPARNVDFSEIQQLQPDSRALISIYDVPLTYLPSVGVIHPECKLEVGERMAFSALGMVHNKYESFTTATIEKTEIIDSAVYVTLKNVGDSLLVNGDWLKGFSICGKDGIYVKADAEIINNNTVKIWNKDITEPCSAAYAYSVNNEKSNLFASIGGNATLPVSPFVTNRNIDAKYWSEKTWADCDDEEIWHTVTDAASGFYPSWTCENAQINAELSDKINGKSALRIVSDSDEFTVNPVLNFKDGSSDSPFYDSDKDYSEFGKIEFYIKNTGASDIILSNIRFSKNDALWYSPASGGTSDDRISIPADSKWHLVSFDLNKLYLYGFECGFSYPAKKLDDIKNITFSFSADGKSSLLVDEIRFAPSTEDAKTGFDVNFDNADNPFEYFSCLFVRFIGMIASIF